jgi:phospholipid-binding lipoprotein MlaA
LGFFDPALSWGLEPHDEDFGQVFAHWGADSGSYWVIPVLGPSDTRDGIGLIFDLAVSITTFPPLWLIDAVNWRAQNLERIATNRENALDFYVFVRNAYQQRRDDLIHDFKPRPDHDEEDDLYFIEDDGDQDEGAAADADA